MRFIVYSSFAWITKISWLRQEIGRTNSTYGLLNRHAEWWIYFYQFLTILIVIYTQKYDFLWLTWSKKKK